MTSHFDNIRPYTDAEVPAAMRRIAGSEYLPALCKFVFHEKTLSEVQEILLACKNTDDFQVNVMHQFNKQVIIQTIKQFTCSGLEYLDPKKTYLFVSNHRDIVLDASLLQSALHNEGFRTTEITFGSNLMNPQLVVDIGKSNKMFKVIREGNAREFYNNSVHLSEYIRFTLIQKGESVWIAQRNGRTKDGNDATDQGIIRMFCMSNRKNLVESLAELNIVPIAVSYQWESCDMFKTKELYFSKEGAKYVKQKNEDLTSILTGITQQKGNVHFSICKPIEKEEYNAFSLEAENKFYNHIAHLIDEKIYRNYKLWNTNYIAHDLRSGTSKFSAHYTPEEKDRFLQRFHHILNQIEGDKVRIGSSFLGIYANPVDKLYNV
ncbi:MAG: 1-acyl-sn-glycerol-3-phosphate acyltransferase [Lentimicrobiaceae bacterium]|nr:1-acyl-sn-glycerol-3-phosphate acyltransferase [Lentimicrobiaceae bacterium]